MLRILGFGAQFAHRPRRDSHTPVVISQSWIAFVYVFAVLGVAGALCKALRLPVEFTRKVVHISVGMWA